MGEDDGDATLHIADERWDFLEQFTLRTLNVKNDKWAKLTSNDDLRSKIQDFLDKKDLMFVVISMPPSGALTPIYSFPLGGKMKAVYFVKRVAKEVTKKEIGNQLLFGDLSNIPIDQLSSIVEDIVSTVLTNNDNYDTWPQVVSGDVLRHVHSLKSDVYVTCGAVKGETLLPLPVGSERIDTDPHALEIRDDGDDKKTPVDRQLIHSMQNSVIDWARQVRDIVIQDSSQACIDGKNPTPAVEISFWESRERNLYNIYNQLKNPKIRKLATVLKLINSTYYTTLWNMFQDVKEELEKAQDVVVHIKPLRNSLDELETQDFTEIMEKKFVALQSVLEIIALIWAKCKSYQDPVRIIVLLQEVCNLLIDVARVFLDPENILKGEIDESLEKITTSIKVMKAYSDIFMDIQARIKDFFDEGETVVEWSFAPSLVFARYDNFVTRLEQLENFFKTCLEYQKLEKIEFGGISGGSLSQRVLQLFEEFNEQYKIFTERNYDPLDYNDDGFHDDYASFKKKIDDFDRRLAKCACVGFEDCANVESMFKLLAIFGNLVNRPLIAIDFDSKYPKLLDTYDIELDTAKRIFDKQMEDTKRLGYAPVHRYQPPVAGQLEWARELRLRIQKPRQQLQLIDHPSMLSEQADIVYRKYDQMLGLISEFEKKIYSEWVASVDEACSFNLGQPVLLRDEYTKSISVNFDRALVTVLREVKYLKFLGREDIPEAAAKLFEKNDTLRKFNANLDRTVGWYNEIQESLLDVERPIVQSQLNEIDVFLQEAEKSLYWSSDGLWEYVEKARDMVHDLEKRINNAKDNVDKMTKIMSAWKDTTLYERKMDQKDPKQRILDIENRVDKVKKRFALIEADGKKVHDLIQENSDFFKADTASEEWHEYQDFIDDLLVKGFEACIKTSLNYIIDNMDEGDNQIALFAAKLELQHPHMVFSPTLDQSSPASFQNLITSIVDDVFQMASLVKRAAFSHTDADYQNDMETSHELILLREEIIDRVQQAVSGATDYVSKFEQYAHLWLDDRSEFLRQFLTYGHILTPEEIELHAGEAVPESPPTIVQFKEQIDSYEDLYTLINAFDDTETFDGWFRVSISPFKSALLNMVKKWSLMFKQHIVQDIESSLCSLDTFITQTSTGLNTVVNEGDYDALVETMRNLLCVRDRQSKTDSMFGPIKEYIDLLKTYNHDSEMNDDVHKQLADLPDMWAGLKKLSTQVKQNVAPLQANEVAVIRRHCTTFDVQQYEFRENFRSELFFRWICETPYPAIFISHQSIYDKEMEMEDLASKADLFEVNIPEFKALKACRKEIVLVKEVWDLATLVKSSIDDWKKTSWKEINVEQMDMDSKRFAKEIRTMDKEVRAWDVFTGLDSTVKNMITSFRVIGELQNSAVRDRHWHQLMQTTKVRFTMNESTTLADLLKLNLHNFEDEVRGIVDKAIKEMGMEKVLNELNETWANFCFEHDAHPRTSTPLLRSDEELVETLEDNQVQLQNLMSSKYIAHFLEQVSGWQKKLSTTDSVMTVWFEVQRTWSHLESIFIGSEDIREQLKEDSERFDLIDSAFKGIMAEAAKNTNVVACTNKPGLFEHLERLQGMLTKCEKSLAQYLETKRLAFPRFYFVSSSDLLDILSNGTQPMKVCKHLEKLFDNLSNMIFDDNSKIANMMISQQGEEVPFKDKCDCDGQVEHWLNRVLEHMQDTVRASCNDAVMAYEDKPRDLWIFDYPAQVALTGTCIWWATESNLAFGRLEEGYENAMKDYQKKQIQQLNALIGHLLTDLNGGDRQKIMTICTIDVHARDVVAKLIATKTESSNAFLWQRQLRHRWEEKDNHCYVMACDAEFRYSYEYLGNTPRLVVTPLTDRCYITLTQSLHLVMGGAPAGPAGTGKTETTKDLGRALGIMVYVFNCSEQMDYKSCGNIYKGLSQTGAWGCFDEFNRIAVEVLSVVAVQVKTIQTAIRNKRKRFVFEGEEISLIPTVGLFITMNPGYAGRTELPENLKSLFRPCAMVVPDFAMIAEIMLVAEGFQDATLLSKKFITLYTLCKELLSKQDHYDWGLRAIKSVLVVAGALKRSDRGRPEDQVLMRALRDFNLPKIVTDDTPVFMGLIGDLFPSLDVPRKRDIEFETVCKQAVLDLKLQAEENFVLKLVQLDELLLVRHSVFVIGNAGSGKSCILRSLIKAYQNQKRRPTWVDLNPKVVTNNELFGIINPATREWKDGLFSTIMRDMSVLTSDGPKWIVLDGDIDPMWIESLNTVMDDNKVLTLASNERIPLKPTMRMLFEISHLKSATPATVSRAGILFINAADLGWNPVVTSWIDTREVQSEKANLTILFDKYIPTTIETMKARFKTITPLPEVNHIHTLCYLLESLLTADNTPPDCPKEWYEYYFVFACIWAFGSALFQDQLVDYRVEFSKWWVTEFKTIKFPSQGTIFDYYLDHDTKKFSPWTELCADDHFELDLEVPLQSTIVATHETTRYRYFADLLMGTGRPLMLIGNAGSGKTVLVQDKLHSLPDNYMVANVPFNFYTTSEMLQVVLEKPLEKKAGRNFGPPGTKKLVYFIDDMNMPEVDTYGTVQPHTLLRQHMDYKHWYDRTKLTLKEIHNVQYVSCMNPTAGSFTINPRLQRHFCTFAVSFPGQDALKTIYTAILSQHLDQSKFSQAIVKAVPQFIDASMNLHARCSSTFLPTAIKFHYLFTLRDLSNVFQGLLFSTNTTAKTVSEFAQLLLHECSRVYSDKLINETDIETFNVVKHDVFTKALEEVSGDDLKKEPNIYCHFALGVGEPRYARVQSWESINGILVDALENYNEVNAAMDLVLFEDAMVNVCRINRILESPRGNALLVGVGGSGKQSLSRLAASISALDVFQITLRKGYAIADLKLDIGALYIKAGVKNVPTMFLLTDAQVPDEKFLVLINDLLASGEIPELFQEDEIEEIIAGVRNEVKGTGQEDTRENCWNFFIDRVRRQLKVVLCFSPVGTTLRVRARKFPSLVNCTQIDWFHDWPVEALKSVSLKFVNNIEDVPDELKKPTSDLMAHIHSSVNEAGRSFLENDRRYNYTTPKSFLEQIKLYGNLVTKKTMELRTNMERLENGLEKLRSCSAVVDDLKLKLAAQEIELKQKNEDADKLIEVVGVETEKVSKEKAIADVEEKKVAVIEKEVSEKALSCETDLAKAEPALKGAEAALNTLNKPNLTELKSFGAPSDAIVNVSGAVMMLLSTDGKIPKDRSWKACKNTMAKVDQFLNDLINYDKENIPEACLKAVQPYLNDPEFDVDIVMKKSSAAAGLCSWVINIVAFYRVYCDVEPKRIALAAANAELEAAQTKLGIIQAKIAELDGNLKELTDKFEEATSAKLKCQQEAEATALTINLANRLVGGLASENVRWGSSIEHMKLNERLLPGDCLLLCGFISYIGYFTKSYRTQLLDSWRNFMKTQEVVIPTTEDLDIISLLTDDAAVAAWSNEDLPSDRMSAENATILTNCERWPLMVDPQFQGIKWIKKRYGEALKIVRLGAKGYLETIERAVSNGDVILIESLPEYVDPVLDSLLGRNTIKKGKYIRIGDKEVDYHKDFKLILQTKLSNPHYQPEMQAQCTLINFSVTKDGLEDQLLAEVVRAERPDLEELKAQLTTQQNEFKITLKQLEDALLARLSAAGGNFLGDTALVENLEVTKKTALEIEEKVKEAHITEAKINLARENYRPSAARASLIYFILNDLSKINPMYQFSLKAFIVVFGTAIRNATKSDNVKERVEALIDCLTYTSYAYVARGLFERDKLTFVSQLAFQILTAAKAINPVELDFLLRFPAKMDQGSPVEFLSNIAWGAIRVLSDMDEFRNLDRDIEGSAKRWKKFVESECPEKEKFPQEWKNKTALQKLCMMRCLRPDRMTYALRTFMEDKLGTKYTEGRSIPFASTYEEASNMTPLFFILSPGVDPLKDVEAHGHIIGYGFDNKNFHNVSLGQGQEVVAEAKLELAAKEGHWVILQNIHLVKTWLPTLEKLLENFAISADKNMRVFMSAEPAGDPSYHIIPQGVLEVSIKITNEPPTGIQANLHKALDNFTQDTMEMCSKENEFKSILNSLCYFHAVICERRKFGPQGWNRPYPFNAGDLTMCANVLFNYLETNPKVPWDDLRYLFGEIMYGGHITDDWDRHLCLTYLETLLHPDQLETDFYFAPGYACPPDTDYKGYHAYIDENIPPESPVLYGLHPNAEIDVLTTTSEKLFQTLLEMQPKDTGTTGEGGLSREEQIKQILDDILEKLPEDFNVQELLARCEELTPYAVVALQEAERMRMLTGEIRRSLKELNLGLKGELTISSNMEDLMTAFMIDRVPDSWSKRAYPSMFGLSAWFADLLLRNKDLEAWTGDFNLPNTVWLGGLFNPQSFLTAVMQCMSRKNEWPLDKMFIQCDVTKKNKDDFNTPPREGAYIHGLYIEGARWDTQGGCVAESRLKEMTPTMPVVLIKAINIDRKETRNIYECPVYKTKDRGPTYVWTFNLKTKEKASKWTLGGVAVLLQADI